MRNSSSPIIRVIESVAVFPSESIIDAVIIWFSELRDELGIQSHLTKDKRSGFHDIRSLSIHLLDEVGYESKVRAAQSDDKTNLLYREGHTDWNVAEDVTVNWKR